jgi:hypothetical protein
MEKKTAVVIGGVAGLVAVGTCVYLYKNRKRIESSIAAKKAANEYIDLLDNEEQGSFTNDMSQRITKKKQELQLKAEKEQAARMAQAELAKKRVKHMADQLVKEAETANAETAENADTEEKISEAA